MSAHAEREKVGEATMWTGVVTKPTSILFSVEFNIGDKRYRIPLWAKKRKADDTPVVDKNGAPIYGGPVEVDDDPPAQAQPPQQQTQAPQQPEPDPTDLF